MTILQIHNFYQFRGGEDKVLDSEKLMLESQGNKVITLTANNKSINNILFKRKEFYNLLNIVLIENKIDVAHIHNVYQIIGNKIYELLANHNVPIVQTLHNFRFLCPAGLFMDNQNQICEKCSKGVFMNCSVKKCYQNSYIKSFLMQDLVKSGRKSVLQYVDKFIPLNSFYRDKYVEAGFDANRLIIKPNFLFNNPIDEISTSYKYALFIGRVSTEKGLESLIDAFKTIPYKLKIVGTGDASYIEGLKDRAMMFKNIEFFGFADGQSKEKLIKEASFLVVPSIWYENFPMTILEAYSSSKAIVSSNIGGLPSIINDGETGYLFEPGNSERLKEAVIKILENNKFIELGINGHKYFSENFTEKQNYKQLIEIYKSAIEEKSKKTNAKM